MIDSAATALVLHSRYGQTMIDTVAGLIGLLAAFVFVERLRSTHSRRDLAIALSLAALGLVNLALAAKPTLIDSVSPPHGLQIGLAVVAALAAAALARDALRGGNRFEGTLAVGVAVLGLASLSYFVAPSTNVERLHLGDFLKLLAVATILYGCLVEFRALQRELVKRVAIDERRRMARDMHDGLAQELAFIASHSQRLSHTGEDATTVAHLRSAAERALHDSRTTIAVLTATEELPLDRLIERTADSFRSRFGVEIELDLQQDVLVDDEWRNALLRILHEALNNAVRHGSAEHIRVSFGARENGNGGVPALRIADDGVGFDVPTAVSVSSGLGLTSMQERAGLLGGSLRIASTPGAGTVVEVALP
ncbi:MAG TPA: ATP-binding protein [Solirubrobacteraceae bacterium]|nr:ATP-binding protein [Solirubrobacteraceae bacterium]